LKECQRSFSHGRPVLSPTRLHVVKRRVSAGRRLPSAPGSPEKRVLDISFRKRVGWQSHNILSAFTSSRVFFSPSHQHRFSTLIASGTAAGGCCATCKTASPAKTQEAQVDAALHKQCLYAFQLVAILFSSFRIGHLIQRHSYPFPLTLINPYRSL